MEEIEEEAQRLAGCQFNLGSSAEVSNILFNVLKLAVPPNAKPLRGGKLYSTGAEACVERKEKKQEFALFGNHNGRLQRRQPGAGMFCLESC